MPLLEVKNLKKYFPVRKGFFSKSHHWIKAVDDISFSVEEGETLGLVGESGCGKTTAGRCILRLIEPTAGKIFFEGKNILDFKSKEMRALRTKMQIVFQDPFASLNPRRVVLDLVGEGLLEHKLVKNTLEQKEKVAELLKRVGLSPDILYKYPHEFSGGQRQRIAIARALSLGPSLIVCDEPVSALDVSIQAQIINLLTDLQEEMKLAYIFIAHDLSVVKHISKRIAVMYLGQIVESAPSDELFEFPLHPYTKALLSSIPVPDPEIKKQRVIVKGELTQVMDREKGCVFAPRCPISDKECFERKIEELYVNSRHYVKCIKEGGIDYE